MKGRDRGGGVCGVCAWCVRGVVWCGGGGGWGVQTAARAFGDREAGGFVRQKLARE